MAPDDAAEAAVMARRLRRELDTLSPRDARILRLRFGLDGDELTLKEVGDKYNLSRERTRQIEWQALARIRRAWVREVDIEPSPMPSGAELLPSPMPSGAELLAMYDRIVAAARSR